MTPFAVTSHRQAGCLVVVPTGELDIATVDAVREHITTRQAGDGLVVDMRGLSFVDTSGIQLMVESYRSAREHEFQLEIYQPPDRVHRVFEIAGLDGVLPFSEGPSDG